MKHLSKNAQGEVYIFSKVILWAWFPIVTIFTLRSLSPIFSLAIGSLLAAAFFAVLLSVKGEWKQIYIRSAWKHMILATLFIGILLYGLLFYALQHTTAGNVSILALTEIFFTMIVLSVWGKERLSRRTVAGAILMVLGAFLILFQGGLSPNIGDLLVLIAVSFAPFGNYFAQQARRLVGSSLIMFVRSVVSGLFLLFLGIVIETLPSTEALYTALPYLLINGLLLLGLSKIFWLEAIHRITISKSISLMSMTPAFTLIFAFYALGEIPSLLQIAGFIPIVIGTLLLTNKLLIKKRT